MEMEMAGWKGKGLALLFSGLLVVFLSSCATQSYLQTGLPKSQKANQYLTSGQDNAHREKNKEAVADFTKSLQIENSFAAYFLRGLSYVSLEQYSYALADLTKAINLAPGKEEAAGAYYGRSYAYCLSGKGAPAKADLAKAKKVVPINDKNLDQCIQYADSQKNEPDKVGSTKGSGGMQ